MICKWPLVEVAEKRRFCFFVLRIEKSAIVAEDAACTGRETVDVQ
jgi:hypothetical protein